MEKFKKEIKSIEEVGENVKTLTDWEKFKNSIIVTKVEGTKKINTRVFDVIKFS